MLIISRVLLTLFLLVALPVFSADLIQDEFAENTLKDVEPVYTHTKYDYTNLDVVPIKLCVAQNIKSEAELYEGQEIEFKKGDIFKMNFVLDDNDEE